MRVDLGSQLSQLRADAGLSARAVARAAGISPSHLGCVERGTAEASTGVLVAIADVLGADPSIKAYPGTGPMIHDHIQARIVEELVRSTIARWRVFVEVPVRRPARGYIDVVLAERAAPRLVSTELHSDLRRLEQQLRWAQEKATSLPSADLWRQFDRPPEVSSLLVLRSTARTRQLVDAFAETIRAVFPARPADPHAALTGDAPWPGSGLLWARVDGRSVTLLAHPPRGVRFGG